MRKTRRARSGAPASAGAPRRIDTKRLSIQVVAILAGALTWEVYGQVWGSNFTIPPLSDVLAAAPGVLLDGEFWAALGTTMLALLLGLVLVVGAGFPLGVAAGMSRVADKLLSPYMTVGLAAPMIAVIPIIQILFGLGLAARLGVIVIFALPYFVVNVAAGYRETPGDLLKMCTSFGVSPMQTFWKVRTFAALPAILAGARLAVARAFVGVIIAELLVLATGIGRIIARDSGTFNLADMYVSVLSVLLLAVLVLRGLTVAERGVLRRTGVVR